MAAGWFARHGLPVEAVRHALGARNWGLAARLLADHWPGLLLGGQAAAVHELLAGFSAEARGGCGPPRRPQTRHGPGWVKTCALALVSLGIAKSRAARFKEAGRHLEDGTALAVELAERHGWTDEPAVGSAYQVLERAGVAGKAGEAKG